MANLVGYLVEEKLVAMEGTLAVIRVVAKEEMVVLEEGMESVEMEGGTVADLEKEGEKVVGHLEEIGEEVVVVMGEGEIVEGKVVPTVDLVEMTVKVEKMEEGVPVGFWVGWVE